MEQQLFASAKPNQPYQTIQDALNAAGALAPAPVTITLSGGRYYTPTPIAITQSNLTLRAAEGEEVIFTGSLPLSFERSHWQPCALGPNIYATQLAKGLAVDGFFADDKPQILARYPNFNPDVLPLGGVVSAGEIKARAKYWQNPSTGYLRALHHMGWGGNDYYITGKDDAAETGLALQWVGDNNRGEEYMPSSVLVEGILEELDAPGEWFYEAATGILYFYPPVGMNLNKGAHRFEVAVCSELFTIYGETVENPLENITFEGITLQNTKRSMFDAAVQNAGKPYTPLLRGDWAVMPLGAITIENAKNVAIARCNFTNIGGNAIFFAGYNQDHTVTACRFCHLGACGVQIVGKPSAVSDPSFWPHAHNPELQIHANTVADPAQVGPVGEAYPRDITLAENYIYDIGIYEKQSSGVNCSIASRVKILHNTIHKSARSNININDGSFGGHEIAYNDIFDAQRETTDHGPFNAWGRDRFWTVPCHTANGQHGEIMRHYGHTDGNEYDTSLLDAYQTTSIHHNRFHHAKGAPHTWGIDLDDGSSNYEIYQNLCLGLGIKLREGFARRVHDNIIIDGKLEIHVSYAEARDEITRNLIINRQPWNFIAVDAARYAKAEYKVDGNWYHALGLPIVMPSWFTTAQGDASIANPANTNPAAPETTEPTATIANTAPLPDANALFDADPLFANPAAGDFTPTNTAAMAQIGFAPFGMAFGAAIAKDEPSGTSPHYPLEKGDSKEAVTYLWQRAALCDIDDAIISATASAGYEGCYVIDAGRGDAAKAGLRGHDIVKAINGETVADTLAFLGKINALEAANASTILTLHREGGVHNLTIR